MLGYKKVPYTSCTDCPFFSTPISCEPCDDCCYDPENFMYESEIQEDGNNIESDGSDIEMR